MFWPEVEYFNKLFHVYYKIFIHESSEGSSSITNPKFRGNYPSVCSGTTAHVHAGPVSTCKVHVHVCAYILYTSLTFAGNIHLSDKADDNSTITTHSTTACLRGNSVRVRRGRGRRGNLYCVEDTVHGNSFCCDSQTCLQWLRYCLKTCCMSGGMYTHTKAQKVHLP